VTGSTCQHHAVPRRNERTLLPEGMAAQQAGDERAELARFLPPRQIWVARDDESPLTFGGFRYADARGGRYALTRSQFGLLQTQRRQPQIMTVQRLVDAEGLTQLRWPVGAVDTCALRVVAR
jgi:hypothetical protein